MTRIRTFTRHGCLAAIAAFLLLFLVPQSARADLTAYGTGRQFSFHYFDYSNHCIDAEQYVPAGGGKVQVWDCNNAPAQLFTWALDGTIRLQIGGQPHCLTASGGLTAVGAPIKTTPCTGGATQRWRPYAGTMVQLVGTDKCMNLNNGDLTNGTVILLFYCYEVPANRWHGVDPAPGYESGRLDSVAARGRGAAYRLQMNTAYCLDAQGVVPAEGGKVQLWTCNNGSDQELFWGSDGALRVMTIALGQTWCLTAVGGVVDGAPVRTLACSGAASQRWEVVGGTMFRLANSRLCLATSPGSIAEGLTVELSTCDGSVTQRWTTPITAGAVPRVAVDSLLRWGASASIRTALAADFCMDAENAVVAEGAKVQLLRCTDQGSQSPIRWAADGTMHVTLAGQDRCLAPAGGSAVGGTAVRSLACAQTANQQWEGVSGSSVIRLAGTTLCMDLAGGNLLNGTLVLIQSCNGTANQKWTTPLSTVRLRPVVTPKTTTASQVHGTAGSKLFTITNSGGFDLTLNLIATCDGFSACTMNRPLATWALCASESGTCAFTGTRQVAYGAGGRYDFATLTDGSVCSNAVFGDPYPGASKRCYVKTSAGSVAQAPWTDCAAENADCPFTGPKEVRFGANGQYNSFTLNNGHWCSIEYVFGNPGSGSGGRCATRDLSPDEPRADWTYCAWEGEYCAFSGTKEVLFGTRGSYSLRVLSDGTSCTSARLEDPTPGSKHCYYRELGAGAEVQQGWTMCATEGGVCVFSGTKEVQYGANGHYTYLTATNGTLCAGSVFGTPIATPARKCAYREGSADSVRTATLRLPAGGSDTVRVWYTASSTPQTAAIRLVASNAMPAGRVLSDTGSVSVTSRPLAGGVAFSPHSYAPTIQAGLQVSSYFWVKNTGDLAQAYTLSVSCSGVVINCTTANVPLLAAGDSTSSGVSWTTSGPGNGSFTWTATNAGGLPAQDVLVANVTAIGSGGSVPPPPPPPDTSATPAGAVTVRTANVNPGPSLERGACLTIAVSASAVAECGDLRIAHALPAVTTMGRTRAPMLTYVSRHAAPVVLVAANVSAQVSIPGGLLAKVIVRKGTDSVVIQKTFAWDNSWSNGQPRRIVIPVGAAAAGITTGAYRYTVDVGAASGGSGVTAGRDTGMFTIVDRRDSEFGAGWMLDGLERLLTTTPDSATQRLWVGGDGSTRLYVRSGSSDAWIGSPVLARADTLERVSSTNTWRRHLPNGAYVEFTNGGLHVGTRDARGKTTTFGYSTIGARSVVTSIVLPVRSGAAPSYGFAYALDASQLPRIDSVIAPGMRWSKVSASTGMVTDVRDTIGITSFAYQGGLLTKRVNALRDTTRFTYDSAGMLATSSIVMQRSASDNTPPITSTFCAAESRSLSTCGGGALATPVPLGKVYSHVNGPRTNVADTTVFFVNRFGAPDTVVNAVGQRTRTWRNALRPLLADSLIDPSGLVTVATYNSRGLLDTARVRNPHGTGDAVTTYGWDTMFDLPTRIQEPSGVVATRAYNRSDATLEWAETGGDTTRFSYFGDGLINTATRVALGTVEYFDHDAFGNLKQYLTPFRGTTTILRDALGRDSISTVPAGGAATATTLTLYDGGGRDTLHRTTGGTDTLRVVSRYDAEANLLSVTQTAKPDRNSIGSVSHTFTYDAAGRQVTDSLGGSTDGAIQSFFDEAGNLIGGGRTLAGKQTTYDALDRPIATSSGYDGSTFTYDAAGLLRTANNAFAQISRGYDAAGALVADTVRLASAGAQVNTVNDFSKHQYVFTYAYDPAGRRLSMTQPSILGGGTTSYTYADLRSGQLTRVIDPAGIAYRYHYDLLGRRDTLVRRSGLADSILEHRTYDLASRVETRGGKLGSTVLYADGLAYDQQDRVVRANGSDTVAYDPLGHATYSRISATGNRIVWDALGNQVTDQRNIPHAGGGTDEFRYHPQTARLKFINRPGTSVGDTTFYDTDFLGNVYSEEHVVWSYTTHQNQYVGYVIDDFTPDFFLRHHPLNGPTQLGGGTLRRESNQTRSNFDQDNRLYYSAFRIDSLYGPRTLPANLPMTYAAEESYRYDALGRRVWVGVRRDTTCTYAQPATRCLNSVTRVLWDGNQIAGEIRAADTTTTALDGDRDTDIHPLAGIVSYTHDGDVDHPLAIRKLGAKTVYPMLEWRGVIGSGVCQSGTQPAARCGIADSLQFPLRAAGLFGGAQSTNGLGPSRWYGSLIEGLRDGSGKVYQRNRYLDPETGRFTQEDPIGLAGGLNLYGFAGGDPVSYSDPFGLCPTEDKSPRCKKVWSLGVSAGGAAGVGGAASMGVAWTGEGPAVWSSAAYSWGVGGGVGVNGGMAPSLDAFRGMSTTACVGGGVGVGGSVCGSMSNSPDGWQFGGTSVGVGVGPTPIEIRGEISYTRVLTMKDAKQSFYQFLKQVEAAIIATGRPK